MAAGNDNNKGTPVANVGCEIDPALKEGFESVRKAEGFSTTSEALRHLIRVKVAEFQENKLQKNQTAQSLQ